MRRFRHTPSMAVPLNWWNTDTGLSRPRPRLSESSFCALPWVTCSFRAPMDAIRLPAVSCSDSFCDSLNSLSSLMIAAA